MQLAAYQGLRWVRPRSFQGWPASLAFAAGAEQPRGRQARTWQKCHVPPVTQERAPVGEVATKRHAFVCATKSDTPVASRAAEYQRLLPQGVPTPSRPSLSCSSRACASVRHAVPTTDSCGALSCRCIKQQRNKASCTVPDRASSLRQVGCSGSADDGIAGAGCRAGAGSRTTLYHVNSVQKRTAHDSHLHAFQRRSTTLKRAVTHSTHDSHLHALPR